MKVDVVQQLRVAGSRVQEVVAHLAGPDGGIDFGKVEPIPDELYTRVAGPEHPASDAWDDNFRQYLTLARVEKGGAEADARAVAWQVWCIAHWGTGWNAYAVSDWEFRGNRASIRFSTADYVALPVFLRLSSFYPAEVFELRYLDQGLTVGTEVTIMDGKYSIEGFWRRDNNERFRQLYREIYGMEASAP